jgi:hypothetical protein
VTEQDDTPEGCGCPCHREDDTCRECCDGGRALLAALSRLQAVAALEGTRFGYEETFTGRMKCLGCGTEVKRHADGCPVGLYEDSKK